MYFLFVLRDFIVLIDVYSHLRNVTISGSKSKPDRPSIEFNIDGTLKHVELDIMNLNNFGHWDKVSIYVYIVKHDNHFLLRLELGTKKALTSKISHGQVILQFHQWVCLKK